MSTPFSILDDQSLSEIFSFLSFNLALRLHATGSNLFRRKFLRDHIGSINTEDAIHVRKPIKNLKMITLNPLDDGRAEDDVQVIAEREQEMDIILETLVYQSQFMTVLKLRVYIDFDRVFESLPEMLEVLELIDDVKKSSSFERFTALAILDIIVINEYDKPFPPTLRRLSINDIDSHIFDQEGQGILPPAHERVSLALLAPGLTHLDAPVEDIDCVNLPSSLLVLKCRTVRDSFNLATFCPSLRRLSSRNLDYKTLKLPSSMTRIACAISLSNLESQQIDYASLFKGLRVDLYNSLDVKYPNININGVVGKQSNNLKKYENAKKIFLTLGRTPKVDNAISFSQMAAIPTISYFPSKLTNLKISTCLMSMSKVMLLPDCIETIQIIATFVHDPCDLLSKTSLVELIFNHPTNAVSFPHSVILPPSLDIYKNATAIISHRDLPLPNLTILRISVCDGFDFSRLPNTIEQFYIFDYMMNKMYNPIDGYKWTVDDEVEVELHPSVKRRELHFSGLVYLVNRTKKSH